MQQVYFLHYIDHEMLKMYLLMDRNIFLEGGAVCFEDKQLGDKLYELKNFGIHGPEEVSAVGANAKMNEFCAAMGLHKYDQ